MHSVLVNMPRKSERFRSGSGTSWHVYSPWWRHQMETFSMLLAFWAGNSPITGEFPTQRPVMQSFDVFFDLCLNKRLSKQSWGWWFYTPSCWLWRHCYAYVYIPWSPFLFATKVTHSVLPASHTDCPLSQFSLYLQWPLDFHFWL